MVNSPATGPSNALLRMTHIPTHTIARTTMIIKNTAAMATTTYSHMEEGSWVLVATVGSVGEGILEEGLEEDGGLVGVMMGGEEEEGEALRRTGVEDGGWVGEEVAGGDSQARDMGTELFSEITAHFSAAGSALRNMLPLTHGPSALSISSTFESPNSNWSLGTYSASPSMLHVYLPAYSSVMSEIVNRDLILRTSVASWTIEKMATRVLLLNS